MESRNSGLDSKEYLMETVDIAGMTGMPEMTEITEMTGVMEPGRRMRSVRSSEKPVIKPVMTPGDIILLKRTELGITQEDLEWESGISARQIGNIERNRNRPTFETIQRLEEALGIHLMKQFVAYWRRDVETDEKISVRESMKKLEKELLRRRVSEKEIQTAIDNVLADLDSKKR